MNKLIMAIGLPCSGKDTVIEEWYRSVMVPTYTASTDAIIEMVASELRISYHEAFKINFVYPFAVKLMNFGVERAIAKGHDVIWNQTNLTPSVRKYKLTMFSRAGYLKRALVILPPSIDELLARNTVRQSKTGKYIDKDIFINMKNIFTVPTLDEGFHEIWTLKSIESYADNTSVLIGQFWYQLKIECAI